VNEGGKRNEKRNERRRKEEEGGKGRSERKSARLLSITLL
jgi:hypothetical protein